VIDLIMEAESDCALSVHPTQGKEFTPPPSGPRSQVSHQFVKKPISVARNKNKRKKLKARMQPETNLTKDYTVERFKNSVTKEKGKARSAHCV
jgi:hypothetical protein